MPTALPPFEQLIAQTLTTAAIDVNAASSAVKLARAITAQSVAGILATAATGDLATANAQLAALIGAIGDPGLNLIAQNLWAIGSTLLQAEAIVLAATPVLGATVKGILSDVSTGMSQVAAAYIAAYGAPPASKPAA
ncbi:MAG: hypothetical protein ACRDF8_00770 [Chloroflexota bacterium]